MTMTNPDWLPDDDARAFQACRTLGHSWDEPLPNTADDPRPPTGTVLVKLRCLRCTMLRYDYVAASTFAVVGRSYRPPLGYRHVGHYSRSDWRGAYLRGLGVVSRRTVRQLKH